MDWSVLGHQQQKNYFQDRIERSSLGHAYLFVGPDQVGKKMFAEDIIRTLLPAGYVMDVLRCAPEVDEETGKKKDIPVEKMRDMKAWLALRPSGAHKIVCIDDADWLGTEAANTLLKSLEEPPAYAHFFLITGRQGSMLSTVASRCELIRFGLLSEDDMQEVLDSSRISTQDRAILAAVAAGQPGKALQLVSEDKLKTMSSSLRTLETVLKAGAAEKIAYAKQLADDEHVAQTVGQWLAYLHGRLHQKPHLAPMVGKLLATHALLEQPYYNRRLLLEDFLLSVQK